MRVVLTPFLVVPKNKLRFSAFVVVNCLFGAFGILCPLAVSGYTSGAATGFWKLLNDGNAYTFAVSLLAAASFFLIADAIAERKTQFRTLRIGAMLSGVVWLVWLSVWASIHFSLPSDPKTYPWSGAALVQLISALLTVWFAIWLFCVERLDDHTDEELVASLRDRKRLLKRPSDPRI